MKRRCFDASGFLKWKLKEHKELETIKKYPTLNKLIIKQNKSQGGNGRQQFLELPQYIM